MTDLTHSRQGPSRVADAPPGLSLGNASRARATCRPKKKLGWRRIPEIQTRAFQLRCDQPAHEPTRHCPRAPASRSNEPVSLAHLSASPLSPGAMVLGFETAKRTPPTVSPSPAPSVAAVPEPVLLTPPPDHGHLDHALLSPHAVATTASHTDSPRKESNNMISQDGEVEGRPPYLHVRRLPPPPPPCPSPPRTSRAVPLTPSAPRSAC